MFERISNNDFQEIDNKNKDDDSSEYSLLNYNDFNFLKNLSIIGTSAESVFYNDSTKVYEFNLENYILNHREDLSVNGIVLTDDGGISNSYDTLGCVSAYLDQENNFIFSDYKHYFGYFYNDINCTSYQSRQTLREG